MPRRATPLLILAQRTAIACAALALAACGTFSGRTSTDSRTKDTQASSRSGSDLPRKRGGYYLDDGPGDNAPSNLDAIPDAVPKAEPLHRGTGRPYTVMGRSYTPMTQLAPYRARGVATWYGRRYHGQRTASGEVYDMYAMTAAHTTLPIPSYARVTNVDNGRSVVVRINDRGPFLDQRLIDLSYVAAHKLDIVRNGSALVEVESMLPLVGAPAIMARRTAEPVTLASPGPTPAQSPSHTSAQAEPAPALPPVAPRPGDHYLQLAAFSVPDNALRFMERMQIQLGDLGSALSMTNTNNLFRVRSGPYASQAEALAAAERIGQLLGTIPMLTAPR
jgi:rare lipoprotein A